MSKEWEPTSATEALATAHVIDVESDHLSDLLKKAEDIHAEMKNAHCCCFQCDRRRQRRLDKAIDEYVVEKNRMDRAPLVDHEEEWIADHFGRKRFDEHWDDPMENCLDDEEDKKPPFPYNY